MDPKWLHLGAVLEIGATSEGGAVFSQSSATGGAELHTMKRLQGWSHFGSTIFSVFWLHFFLSVELNKTLLSYASNLFSLVRFKADS